MQRGQVAPVTTLALAATLTLGAVLAAPSAKAATVSDTEEPAYTFAVIGDVPYGTAAEDHFPTFIQGINADPDVTMVTHLGDIKSGSTTCTDERFARVRHDFDGFEDPLVYTPATTSGPTATVRTTAATSPSSGSRRCGRCSSPTPAPRWAPRHR